MGCIHLFVHLPLRLGGSYISALKDPRDFNINHLTQRRKSRQGTEEGERKFSHGSERGQIVNVPESVPDLRGFMTGCFH